MLRWIDGFERSQNVAILGRLYSVQNTDTPTTATGRRGVGVGLQGDTLTLRSPELVAVDENTWVVGFAFLVNELTGLASSPSAIPYVSLRNGSGEQLRLEFIHAGAGTSNTSKPGGRYYRVRIMRGLTEIARSDQVWSMANLPGSAWVYFEWKVTVDTTTGGSVELMYHLQKKVKNQTVTWDNSVSGINTANQGAAGADSFELSWNTGADADDVVFDDVYVLDDTGSKNNDFLGEIHIEGLTVQGTGDTNEWSLAGSASNVEDALNEAAGTQSTTEDDKRITSDTVGQITLATLSNLTGILTTDIIGVQVNTYGKMETSGSRDIQVMWRKTTGSPAQTGGAIRTVDSTSIVGFADTQEDDPNTATDWVHADIDGLQVGVELDA